MATLQRESPFLLNKISTLHYYHKKQIRSRNSSSHYPIFQYLLVPLNKQSKQAYYG